MYPATLSKLSQLLAILSLALCSSLLHAADWTVQDLPHIDGTPLLPEEGDSPWLVMEASETEDGEIISAWLENQGDLAYLVYSDNPNPEEPEVFIFGDGYEVELINEVNLHFITLLETELTFGMHNSEFSTIGTEAHLSFDLAEGDAIQNLDIKTNGDIVVRTLEINGDLSVTGLDNPQSTNSFYASDSENHWIVTGNNSGNLSIGNGQNSANISFSGFEELIGGDSNDTFVLNSDSYLGTINGGSGVDTIDISSGTDLSAWPGVIADSSGATLSGDFHLDGGVVSLAGGDSSDSFCNSDSENEEEPTTTVSSCSWILEFEEVISEPVEAEEGSTQQDAPRKKKKGGAVSLELILAMLVLGLSLPRLRKHRKT